MNWKNLKNNKCPKCGELLQSSLEKIFSCPSCDFKISEKKFEKIVNSFYKPKKREEVKDNFDELQNFGREEASEGYL